jgi:hypothetical protein
VEVHVRGDSLIDHSVNGEPVLSYTGPQIGGGMVAHADASVKQNGRRLTEGRIALQSESHPIQLRTVEVRPLDPGEMMDR